MEHTARIRRDLCCRCRGRSCPLCSADRSWSRSSRERRRRLRLAASAAAASFLRSAERASQPLRRRRRGRPPTTPSRRHIGWQRCRRGLLATNGRWSPGWWWRRRTCSVWSILCDAGEDEPDTPREGAGRVIGIGQVVVGFRVARVRACARPGDVVRVQVHIELRSLDLSVAIAGRRLFPASSSFRCSAWT